MWKYHRYSPFSINKPQLMFHRVATYHDISRYTYYFCVIVSFADPVHRSTLRCWLALVRCTVQVYEINSSSSATASRHFLLSDQHGSLSPTQRPLRSNDQPAISLMSVVVGLVMVGVTCHVATDSISSLFLRSTPSMLRCLAVWTSISPASLRTTLQRPIIVLSCQAR